MVDVLSNTIQHEKSHFIPVYNHKLSGFLQLRGFVLMNLKENYKTNDGKMVYYFRNSDALKQTIDEFKMAYSNKERLIIQL